MGERRMGYPRGPRVLEELGLGLSSYSGITPLLPFRQGKTDAPAWGA
jgi:hypothetical protein